MLEPLVSHYISHIGHGKTTLTSAITQYLSKLNMTKFYKYEEIDKTPEEKKEELPSTVPPSSTSPHYSHVDCPGHADYIKNVITRASKMDGGILVVSASDSTMPQTKEHILLCRQI